MKRILLSLVVSGAVLGTAIYATNAYFSDIETSSGNTFQAGKIDLQIKSQCSYNGDAQAEGCGNWDYSLDGKLTSEKFFNFTDVKPGDVGENTISFTIKDNSAWMCANLTATTKEKLADYLDVLWWVDTNGDNKYQNTEKVLYDGPRTLTEWLDLGNGTVLPLTFADSYLNWETWTGIYSSPNTLPILGNTEQHLGVAWCFGDMTVSGDGNPGYSCNGSGEHNDAQGKKVVADLTFTVEQHRNNPDFLCPEHRAQ